MPTASNPYEPTEPGPSWLDELDSLFGAAAVMDLDARNLLPTVDTVARVDAAARPTPVPGIEERITGALLGAAAGNALGAPLRGLSADEIRRRFGRVDSYLTGGSRAAATTADGQLLALWTTTLGTHDLDAAAAFADALATIGPSLRGPGRATVHTLDRLAAGVPWYAAAPASFGDAALVRAVADGCRFALDPGRRLVSVALGTVVTHAHPNAVAAGAIVAEAIASLVCEPAVIADRHAFIDRITAVAPGARVATELRRVVGGPTIEPRSAGRGSTATHALLDAFAALYATSDPVDAVVGALNAGGDTDIVASLVAALVGAAHGPDAFPGAWITELADRVVVSAAASAVAHACTSGTTGTGTSTTGTSTTGPRPPDEEPAHVWFLLDRSGSMQPLQAAVVDGFNEFLAEQQAKPRPTIITVAQFDGQDPYEVLIDAARLPTVAPMGLDQFVPRGMTPLFDAIGSLLDAAEARIAQRVAAGDPEEDQLVVVFTDGAENASRRWSGSAIHARIEALKAKGWTFVFLGANQDSYATGDALAVAAGSVSNYAASPSGTRKAWSSVGRSMDAYLAKERHRRVADRDEFFGGTKEAEEE